ncbi:hypothetical protein [Paraoerskovia marina]|uniref:Uncharacterized protein n=1 Tax=Paraoerskovia marina TaxID=545619 RepID=A0A1H1N3F8_9CELL|nr:hypothetical protein [Paraoerskovia marina]SDR93516.1 hypothetical protein SAMN04489860_0422 [Paraoerskovia marina]
MAPHLTSSQMFWTGLALVVGTLLGIVSLNGAQDLQPESQSELWIWAVSGTVLQILQMLGIVLVGASLVTRVIEHYNGD